MRFAKMQATGNDYIYVNCFEERISDPSALAVQMSRPHYGVGSDGLILIGPSSTADFAMTVFNADGSESEMCGNAARCVAKYVYERGLTDKRELLLETKGGIRRLRLFLKDGLVARVRVDMGEPELRPERIPVDLPGETVISRSVSIGGVSGQITCVSMGNPHCVVFVEDTEALDLPYIGPIYENSPLFPHRTNTEFVSVEDRRNLRMRVWERGSGETLACGTGACAALVAAVLCGRSEREVLVSLRGGELSVSWDPEDNHVYQEGPAYHVFDGEWPD